MVCLENDINGALPLLISSNYEYRRGDVECGAAADHLAADGAVRRLSAR
jgi:hypothetical protein